MEEAEETELCRVCRSEGTAEEPLFHPCKCSGSIRFVHQSCLSEWLSHSRRNYCELCRHSFSFTPIYSETMPENIPFYILIYRGFLSMFRGAKFVVRCVSLGLFWLILLPYFILSTFRTMLGLTDKGAKLMAFGFQSPHHNLGVDSIGPLDPVELYTLFIDRVLVYRLGTAGSADSGPTSWSEFWGECFKGQVITVVVVSSFLLLFLLREWAFHAFPQLNTGAPLPGENRRERTPPTAPLEPIPPIPESELPQLPAVHNVPYQLRNRERFPVPDPLRTRALDDRARARRRLLQRTGDIDVPYLGEHGEMYNRRYRRTNLIQEVDRLEQEFYANNNRFDQLNGSNLRFPVDQYHQVPTSSDPDASSDPVTPADQEDNHSSTNSSITSPQAQSQFIRSSSESAGQSTTPKLSPPPLRRHASASHDSQYSEESPSLLRKRRAEPFDDHYGDGDDDDSDNSDDYEEIDMPPRPDLTSPLARRGMTTYPGYRNHVHLDNIPIVEGEQNIAEEDEGEDNREDEEFIPLPARERAAAPGERAEAPEAEAERAPADEVDDGLGEDLNGMAEFLGIHGDPHLLLQYAVMLFIVVSAGLWGFIGLPYLLGRFTLLLELPIIIAFPWVCFKHAVNFVRMATDPLTNYILYQLLGHFFVQNNGMLTSNQPSEKTQSLLDLASEFAGGFVINCLALLQSTVAALSPVDQQAPAVFGPSYSHFWAAYTYVDQIRLHFAANDRVWDRLVTTWLGYAVIVGGYVLFVNISHLTNPDLVSIRRIIYVMTKIAVFVLLEIVVFPFLCGLLLDCVTLPLFEGASVASRSQLFHRAPLSMIFIHWFFGTVFFFLFSMFMTQCRAASRKGLLWFIRDPNEANPQPVRDIIARSVKDQLFRLGVSSLVYTIIICSGAGVVIYSGKPLGLLPLRLAYQRPFHEVSFDLLFIELLIPAFITRYQPQTQLSAWFKSIWNEIAHVHRLSSFITGRRVASEEEPSLHEKHFRRTPNSDTVTIVPGRRMVIECHPDGRPINPIDVPADSPLYNNANVTITYAPPYLGTRIICFIITVSTVCNIFGWCLLFVPLILGRWLAPRLIRPSNMPYISDLYSYNIGLLTIAMTAFILRMLYLEFESVKAALDHNLGPQYFARSVGKYTKILKQLYISVCTWIVIPFLAALLFDMYYTIALQPGDDDKFGILKIIGPRKHNELEPSMISLPERITYLWSIGVSMLLTLQRYTTKFPNGYPSQILPHHLLNPNLDLPDYISFTKECFGPILVMALVLYGGPHVVIYGIAPYFGFSDHAYMMRYYTQLILLMALWYVVLALGSKYLQKWQQAIRDDEYLVGMALNNMEGDRQPTDDNTESTLTRTLAAARVDP